MHSIDIGMIKANLKYKFLSYPHLPTGLGGCNVFRWDGRGHPSWMRMDTRVELPPDTLVYGELVTEYRGEGRTQRKLTVLHLIDALVLNGKDVRTLHIVERFEILFGFNFYLLYSMILRASSKHY